MKQSEHKVFSRWGSLIHPCSGPHLVADDPEVLRDPGVNKLSWRAE